VVTTCAGPEYIMAGYMTRVLMKQLKCCILVDDGCLTFTNPFPFSDDIYALVDASLNALVCTYIFFLAMLTPDIYLNEFSFCLMIYMYFDERCYST